MLVFCLPVTAVIAAHLRIHKLQKEWKRKTFSIASKTWLLKRDWLCGCVPIWLCYGNKKRSVRFASLFPGFGYTVNWILLYLLWYWTDSNAGIMLRKGVRLWEVAQLERRSSLKTNCYRVHHGPYLGVKCSVCVCNQDFMKWTFGLVAIF